MMTLNIRSKKKLLSTAGLLSAASLLSACAVSAQDGYYDEPYGYNGYGYDDDYYAYDRYDRGDTLYLEDVSSRSGIDNARYVHRTSSEAYAERVDGHCERVVSVRSGDTLSDIAEFCDVPVRALMEANNLYSPHRLEVGQRLRVPAVKGHVYDGVAFTEPRRDHRKARAQTVRYDRDDHYKDRYDDRHDERHERRRPLPREDVAFYRVRGGEEIDDIAHRFDVSERTIIALNPVLMKRDVMDGERIALPEDAVDYHEARREDRYNDRYDDEYRDRHDARYAPVVKLSDDRIRYGENVEVVVENLPPRTDIVLSFGGERSDRAT